MRKDTRSTCLSGGSFSVDRTSSLARNGTVSYTTKCRRRWEVNSQVSRKGDEWQQTPGTATINNRACRVVRTEELSRRPKQQQYIFGWCKEPSTYYKVDLASLTWTPDTSLSNFSNMFDG